MPSLRALALSVPKPVLAVVLPTAVVAVTGVAVSYWTAGGSTTGTAGTAAATTALTVTQTAAPSDMGPGVAAGPIAVLVRNGGTQSVRASSVAVGISAVTPGSPGATCTAADYALSGTTMTAGAAELAPNASTTFSGVTLAFANDPSRLQDGCKGATVTLSYTVS